MLHYYTPENLPNIQPSSDAEFYARGKAANTNLPPPKKFIPSQPRAYNLLSPGGKVIQVFYDTEDRIGGKSGSIVYHKSRPPAQAWGPGNRFTLDPGIAALAALQRVFEVYSQFNEVGEAVFDELWKGGHIALSINLDAWAEQWIRWLNSDQEIAREPPVCQPTRIYFLPSAPEAIEEAIKPYL